MKNKLSIVNFVRGCEPRYKRDLFTPVEQEMKADREAGLCHTYLLQYDAMVREDFRELFLKNRDERTELGVWFEMNRPLTEAVGIEWRGRPGYDWDWYVNPGFLPAYTTEQREKLIDEAFRLFKEIFGEYPSVAGSWLIDAYSVSYMSKKYGVKAVCICREQYAVDAYTLWGGYYSGGYYPSNNNLLCPSQSPETKIKTPVFRMLGADPIYCYDEKKYKPSRNAYTLEPVWASGHEEKIIDWYLREYYNNPSVNGSYLTTGQENSFSWESVRDGYLLQVKKIKELRDAGVLDVVTLGQAGEEFSRDFDMTPPTALSALTDWSENGNQSVWYSCKNYRANLFNGDGRLFFRDITKFDDGYRERYLDDTCKAWDATYDNLPVIDGRLWSADGNECAIEYSGRIKDIKTASDGEELTVYVEAENGETGRVTFSEEGTASALSGTWKMCIGTSPDFKELRGGDLYYTHNGFDYSVRVNGVADEKKLMLDGSFVLSIKKEN